MIRLGTFTATLGLAAIIAAHAQAAEGVLTETRHVLSADLAVEAAQAAIASCKAQGWNITASIIDRSGAMKILLAGDGAGGVGRESARRKAYTSALLGVSTDEFGKRLAGGGFNPKVYDAQMVSDAGGVPIKLGNEIIGGIGAAGAPGGDKDEACAKAGLAKIADRLK
ncbi:MAG TPA: heme-binding protein [Stellaceae bacterium]|nr:heme-binding protein [Stellaceae bacterium]